MTGSLNLLFAATLCFVGGHFLLSSQPLRQAFTGLLGPQGFRVLYSVVILAGFVWMLSSYRAAPFVAVWEPPPALTWVPVAIMPVALLFVVCGATTPSPTMVGGEERLADPGARDLSPGMLRVTRHPFLWGTALWAASHLLVNGDAATMVLMGGILLLSLGGLLHFDQRRVAVGGGWGPVKLTTSALPFAALATGRTTMDWPGIGWWRPLLALALYGALLHLHPWVAGVGALPG